MTSKYTKLNVREHLTVFKRIFLIWLQELRSLIIQIISLTLRECLLLVKRKIRQQDVRQIMLNINFWFLLALDYVLICGARLFILILFCLQWTYGIVLPPDKLNFTWQLNVGNKIHFLYTVMHFSMTFPVRYSCFYHAVKFTYY